jgi:hypothetical protein
VVVAVAFVGMVEVSVDEEVDVAAVGNGFVAATGAVYVCGVVRAARVGGSAGVGIGGRDFEAVFVEVVAVGGVKVPVVEIVDVVAMANGSVAAAFAVNVGVGRVDGVFR